MSDRGNETNRAPRIELTPQARGHPLFPVIDFIARSVYEQRGSLDSRLSKLERDVSSLISVQTELQKLVKEFGEGTYNIEKTHYQVTIFSGINYDTILIIV